MYPKAYMQPKSRIIAGLLAIFFGWLGVHRFYLGYISIGVLQLIMSLVLSWFTCGTTLLAATVWGFIEGVMILTGNTITVDVDGVPLVE